jgi:hypothetical protein
MSSLRTRNNVLYQFTVVIYSLNTVTDSLSVLPFLRTYRRLGLRRPGHCMGSSRLQGNLIVARVGNGLSESVQFARKSKQFQGRKTSVFELNVASYLFAKSKSYTFPREKDFLF